MNDLIFLKDFFLESSFKVLLNLIRQLAYEDAFEQRSEQVLIFSDELGHVHVIHSLHQYLVLLQLCGLPFESPCQVQHRLDCSHPKVIMVLFAQLLHHQVVQSHYLLS